MNVNVHIERLVLDGVSVPPNQRARLKLAVEAELARLLGKGLPDGFLVGGMVERLSGAAIELSEVASPTGLGEHVARAVYEGIKR